MRPFSSSKFFSDAFFADSVLIGETPVSAVVSEIDELSVDGKFGSKTGRWRLVSVLLSALPELPPTGGKLTLSGQIYRIDSVAVSGDVVELKCLSDQRFVK
jgi:hypothetical protein